MLCECALLWFVSCTLCKLCSYTVMYFISFLFYFSSKPSRSYTAVIAERIIFSSFFLSFCFFFSYSVVFNFRFVHIVRWLASKRPNQVSIFRSSRQVLAKSKYVAAFKVMWIQWSKSFHNMRFAFTHSAVNSANSIPLDYERIKNIFPCKL